MAGHLNHDGASIAWTKGVNEIGFLVTRQLDDFDEDDFDEYECELRESKSVSIAMFLTKEQAIELAKGILADCGEEK